MKTSATTIETNIVRRKCVCASSWAKLAPNSVEGTSSIFGLKMPLSGMVEKTAIIQRRQPEEREERASRGRDAAPVRVADFDLMRSLPNQRLRSAIQDRERRDRVGDGGGVAEVEHGEATAVGRP